MKKIFLIILSIPVFCIGIAILCSIVFTVIGRTTEKTDTVIISDKSISYPKYSPVETYNLGGNGQFFQVDQKFYNLAQVGDSLQIHREAGLYARIILTLIRSHRVLKLDSEKRYDNVIVQIFLLFVLSILLMSPLLAAIFIRDQDSYLYHWFKYWHHNFLCSKGDQIDNLNNPLPPDITLINSGYGERVTGF